MIHGSHTQTARLRNKILTPFKDVIDSEDSLSALDEVCRHAIEIDFWLITSPHCIKMSWSDPGTGLGYGFPFKKRTNYGKTHLMDGSLRLRSTQRDSWYGNEEACVAAYIRRPSLSISSESVPDSEEQEDELPTYIVRRSHIRQEPLSVTIYASPFYK